MQRLTKQPRLHRLAATRGWLFSPTWLTPTKNAPSSMALPGFVTRSSRQPPGKQPVFIIPHAMADVVAPLTSPQRLVCICPCLAEKSRSSLTLAIIDSSAISGWQAQRGRTPGRPIKVTYLGLRGRGLGKNTSVCQLSRAATYIFVAFSSIAARGSWLGQCCKDTSDAKVT